MANYASKGGKSNTAKRARSATPPSPDTSLLPSIRLLLDNQWEKFEGRLDTLQETFGQRLKKIEETIDDLKDSVEFQRHDAQEVKAKVEVIEENLRSKEKLLQDEIDKLSTYVARENLIYSGIQEKPGEDVKQVLRDLHVNLLKIPAALADSFEYQRVHRLSGSAEALRGRPRAIKARFVKYTDRVLVQKHAKNLKGTNMYVSEDLPKRIREARQPQIAALKVARRMGKLAFFSRAEPAKLFINNVYMPLNQQEAFVRNFESQRGKGEEARKKSPNTRIPTTMAGATPATTGGATPATTAGATATVTAAVIQSFTEGAAAAATGGEIVGDTAGAAEHNLMVL